MLSLSCSDQSWKSSWFFSVCWLLSPQQLTGSTWSYSASQQSCNGIHSLAWVNACTGEKALERKRTALEMGSKMVCCAQTGNKALSKLRFFSPPCIFNYKYFSYALWWIRSPGLSVWLQQWGGGSWSWGCLVPCRTHSHRSLSLTVEAGKYFLWCGDFHTVSHRPQGFADCFWKVFQVGL